MIPASVMKYWKHENGGRLSMEIPRSIKPGSHKKEWWKCDCGRRLFASICNVLRGRTVSCGRCNEISADDMMGMEFGHLMQKVPKDTLPGSNKEDDFICDCGRTTCVPIHWVFSCNTHSCGRCNEISADDMMGMEFGHLMQKVPKLTMPSSAKKDDFVCDCGGVLNTRTYSVFNGDVKRCGYCSLIVKQWYQKCKAELKKLIAPIEPGFILGGPILALGRIVNGADPFRAVCPACKDTYHPRFSDIKRGRSLTCPCVSNRVSNAAIEVSGFIESLGFETEFEYKVGKLRYDIFVLSKNLLIEYNGKRWHSFEKSADRDAKKRQNAIDFGYKFLCIDEIDWRKNRLVIEDKIRALVA
jgi:hypothetical protein